MTTTNSLIERLRSGDQRVLARMASRIENDAHGSEAVVSELFPFSGRAHVIGVTGAPGVGKSSLLGGLATEVSRRGKRIAVIAIDPSSRRSGGATLGDRIRMSEAALDANVFVRSIASRDRSDGLAPAVADLTLLFDVAGYDIVAIETVGTGQDQVEIADLVHTAILVQIPGAGDSVQLLKAGAMEIADIYVINKSDLPGARRVSRDLRSVLGLTPRDVSSWDPPIVLTSTIEQTGFAQLVDKIDDHYAYLVEYGRLSERNQRMARSELQRAINRRIRLDNPDQSDFIQSIVAALANRQMTPSQAAEAVLRQSLER